jgi:hypothetical protein
MSKQEKVFADGFVFKRRENAPEWVIGNISVKVEDAVKFLNNNAKNGWVNLNVNQAKTGNVYIELDTFEPKKTSNSVQSEKVEADLPLNF